MANHSHCHIDLQLFAIPGDKLAEAFKLIDAVEAGPVEDAPTEDQPVETKVADGEAQPEGTPADEEFDVITYNKQEIKVPKSQRVTLLQKGYNYDKVHQQLEAAQAALKARDQWVADTYGDQGIKTWDEWQQALTEHSRKAKLEEAGLDDETYEDVIKSDPKFRELQKKVEQTEQALKQRQMEERINAELAELNQKFGLEVKSLEEVGGLPNADKIVEYVRRDLSLSDAYFLANRDQILTEQAQKASETAKLQAKSKAHVKPAAASAGDAIDQVEIDPEELAIAKALNPKKSERQIREWYAKNRR